MNVLAVGAHPDDIELGCGATLALHHNASHEVHMLVMTVGAASYAAKHKSRRQEQQESSDRLKAKLWWGESIDCRIIDGHETVSAIENVIDSIQPSCVYVHAPQDTHQDHRIIATTTISAARHVPTVLHYQSPSSQHFDPSVFADVTDTLQDKIDALSRHTSQAPTGILEEDRIRASALHWGHFARCHYAEAFMPARLLWSL